ncbi:MAG: M20/M25/M40 family metallo-hydrolase [Gemmatimonadetes bacterium]|nr:M20/M25/M40 family metallo-hydrolase [Gemmatimonadota bacterium]
MDNASDAGRMEKVRSAVNRERLVETAMSLISVPSPTRSAGAVADRLAEILANDGFEVQRPVADWPEAPAVVVRLKSDRPGPTLQFDGHLDTVHLPFVPPRLEEGVLYGSGASDMKGGIAAAVEALRALRESEALAGGGVLLTAHDHHEGPWGDRRQVRALVAEGFVGDAVMLPEYLADRLPLAGRGMAIFEVSFRREGDPVHEVLRAPETPDVLAAGAELVCRLRNMNRSLAKTSDPWSGRDTVFVGLIESGEIYNQAPVACSVRGTRRWVTPGRTGAVEAGFRELVDELAVASGTSATVDFQVQGDAFRVSREDAIVSAFQTAYKAASGGELPFGGKPFVDDGNTYAALAGIPALTHGPDGKGAHTLSEVVEVDELVRVARVYAMTAVAYCGGVVQGPE